MLADVIYHFQPVLGKSVTSPLNTTIPGTAKIPRKPNLKIHMNPPQRPAQGSSLNCYLI